MKYFVYDRDTRLIDEGEDKEAIIQRVKKIFPNETLIGVEKRPDGSEAGFFVGKVNF